MSASLQRKAPLEACLGIINLAAREGSLFKRTLICRTGVWKGVYGAVEITAERLQRIADKYNLERSKPQNQNDFAPILVNHNRDVEMVKGRVMADLSVEDYTDPSTGTIGKGLFGSLRVDLPDAIQKVDSGQYAQVSLSFDEDDDSLWEVSFVAVEAARRSQALEQGDPTMSVELQTALNKANESNQALAARIRTSVELRRVQLQAATENYGAAEKEFLALSAQLSAGIAEMKGGLIKSQLKGLVREGRLSKAEYDNKLKDLVRLAAMQPDDLKMLMTSYKDRPVSAHVQQFGQSGAQPIAGKMTPAQVREAIKLQREGKGAVSLSVEEPTGDKKEPKQAAAGDDKKKPGEGGDADDMEMDDFEGALKKMGEVEPVMSRAKDFMKKMNESLKKMGEQTDKDAA